MNTTSSSWSRAAVAVLCTVSIGACGGGGGGDDDGGGGGEVTPNAVPVAVAVALGGAASRDQVVTLDGSGSSDEDGDELTYLWTQVGQPDVTGGAGTLEGVAPSFLAPSGVVTLQFDLTVNDGTDTSAPQRVTVNVLEDAGAAIFVDGDAADGGNGSQAAPYRTIKQALLVASGTLERLDVYVKTRAGELAYDERLV